jgi:hypothetical protein
MWPWQRRRLASRLTGMRQSQFRRRRVLVRNAVDWADCRGHIFGGDQVFLVISVGFCIDPIVELCLARTAETNVD